MLRPGDAFPRNAPTPLTISNISSKRRPTGKKTPHPGIAGVLIFLRGDERGPYYGYFEIPGAPPRDPENIEKMIKIFFSKIFAPKISHPGGAPASKPHRVYGAKPGIWG